MRRLSLLVLAVLYGTSFALVTAQKPSAPADRAAPGAALVFDATTHVVFDDKQSKPISDLRNSLTVDLQFCPGWDPSSLVTTGEEDGSRCLLALQYDEDDLRYAVYLTADLGGIAVYNGKAVELFDRDLKRDTWYHLAVVFDDGRAAVLVNGEPIDVRPMAVGQTREACSLFVGASANGTENFFGAIGGLRFWNVALSFAEVAQIRDLEGVPANPMLARHLVAYTAFDPINHTKDLAVCTPLPAWVNAWRVRRYRLQQPFAQAVTWQTDLEKACTQAAKEGKLLVVYTTRGNDRDIACESVEAGPLCSDWWKGTAAQCVPFLDLTDRSSSSFDLPTGSLAIVSPRGQVLDILSPWEEVEFDTRFAMAGLYEKTWRKGTTLDDRAAMVMYDVYRLWTPEIRQRLASLKKEVEASGSEAAKDCLQLAARRQELWDLMDKVTKLTDAYTTARQDAASDPVAWVTKEMDFQKQAFDLWVDTPSAIRPSAQLVPFATLVLGYAMSKEGPEVRYAALQFAAPFAELSPMGGHELRSMIPFVK